ncbi:hypothetical protein BLNAU_15991 [Blattamonas nauphoetae]|uniref:C2H2-type domain-containing protein n=1 Tax=Blattamonas nauphoetae TaxID=2049346 RepID=A0ABQ9X915_9EUKA|nr:hypothetical protein BLNAU_15991 [Blattamonas nauphoetae]
MYNKNIDIDRIASQNDVQQLQQYIQSFTFGAVFTSDIPRQSSVNIVKLISTLQYTVEYLVHFQSMVLNQRAELIRQNKRMEKENKKLRKQLSSVENEVTIIKTARKEEIYESLLHSQTFPRGSDTNGSHLKTTEMLHLCPICKKNFPNDEQLLDHASRRHQTELSLKGSAPIDIQRRLHEAEDRAEKEHTSKLELEHQNKQLLFEIKQLRAKVGLFVLFIHHLQKAPVTRNSAQRSRADNSYLDSIDESDDLQSQSFSLPERDDISKQQSHRSPSPPPEQSTMNESLHYEDNHSPLERREDDSRRKEESLSNRESESPPPDPQKEIDVIATSPHLHTTTGDWEHTPPRQDRLNDTLASQDFSQSFIRSPATLRAIGFEPYEIPDTVDPIQSKPYLMSLLPLPPYPQSLVDLYGDEREQDTSVLGTNERVEEAFDKEKTKVSLKLDSEMAKLMRKERSTFGLTKEGKKAQTRQKLEETLKKEKENRKAFEQLWREYLAKTNQLQKDDLKQHVKQRWRETEEEKVEREREESRLDEEAKRRNEEREREEEEKRRKQENKSDSDSEDEAQTEEEEEELVNVQIRRKMLDKGASMRVRQFITSKSLAPSPNDVALSEFLLEAISTAIDDTTKKRRLQALRKKAQRVWIDGESENSDNESWVYEEEDEEDEGTEHQQSDQEQLDSDLDDYGNGEDNEQEESEDDEEEGENDEEEDESG